MLNKSRTDLLLNTAFVVVMIYFVAMLAIAAWMGKVIIAQIALLTVCLILTARIIYGINDPKMMKHRPEVFRYEGTEAWITLRTSPYFLGNSPVHVFHGDKLLVTTWRGNIVKFKIPVGADKLVFKCRAEDDMATVDIPEGKDMYLYVRPINVLPIRWEVTELDEDMAVDESLEYEEYEKLRLEFRGMDILNLLGVIATTLGVIASIVMELLYGLPF